MATYTSLWQRHWLLERNSILLLLGILIVIAFGQGAGQAAVGTFMIRLG